MAKVWVSQKCPVCKKPVTRDEIAVLVSNVKVTPDDTYQCYSTAKTKVRPLFYSKCKKVVYHRDCFPTVAGFNDV